MPQRRRVSAQQGGRTERDGGENGDLDGDAEQERHRGPSFRAFCASSASLAFVIRSEIRSSSSPDTRDASPPRSAATAFSAEPSKKVSTRCLSADLRAACTRTAGE